MTAAASHDTLVALELLARRAERISSDAAELGENIGELICKLTAAEELETGVDILERISRAADEIEPVP